MTCIRTKIHTNQDEGREKANDAIVELITFGSSGLHCQLNAVNLLEVHLTDSLMQMMLPLLILPVCDSLCPSLFVTGRCLWCFLLFSSL